MIVDMHTNLPSHPEAVPESEEWLNTSMLSGSGGVSRMANSVDDYLKAMAAVDRAVVLGIAPSPVDADNPSDETFSLCARGVQPE